MAQSTSLEKTVSYSNLNSSETEPIEQQHKFCDDSYLPALHVVGTHYDVGYAVGKRFKHEIDDFYQATCLKDTLLPYYQTSNGRQIYEEYLDITKETYPQYVNEIQGIADGCGRPFHEVFLIHIEPEITTLLRTANETQRVSSGCTTLMLNYVDEGGCQQTILAHNEDVVVGMSKSSLYVIHARINADDHIPAPSEEWSALCYPGHLCGNSVTVNQYGMTSAPNRLFPDNVQRGKIPWYIQARAFITAKSIEDLDAMVAKTSRQVALGMSFSVAFSSLPAAEQVVANIEIAPTDENALYGKKNYDIKRIPVAKCKEDGFYYHFNRYERIPGVKEWVGEISSDHRKSRLQESPTPSNVADILSILGDTTDTDFPLYRSGNPPDYLFTGASGIFDMMASTFSIYKDNPSRGSVGAVMQIPLST